MRKYLLAFIISTMAFSVYSQTEFDVEKQFIYKGKHYVPHSLYWTVGTGYGYNFDEKVTEPNLLVDLHFRLMEKYYFGTGVLLSRDQILAKGYDNFFLTHDYLKHSVTNLHITYGYRKMGFRYNLAFFAGPSLNWGFDYSHTDTLGNYYVTPFLQPGIYANAQITYKYFFDMGIGLSAWTSLNKNYQAVGLTLHLYFSAALKRTLKGY